MRFQRMRNASTTFEGAFRKVYVFNRIAVLIQYALPKLALTVFAGRFANAQKGNLTTLVIRWFVAQYGVNMREAENPDIKSYRSFNDFFTRGLHGQARPLVDAAYICPVDGAISQFGDIAKDQIFQAKGHYYSTTALLAGNQALAEQFQDGSFATLYLSPRDYHRIHMPCGGRLMSMTYVPGDLFSVNPATAQGVPGLFARNERVVCEFELDDDVTSTTGNVPKRFVLVLVGATIVGSMATVWHGLVNPPRAKKVVTWDYSKQDIRLKKGEEMGRFLLGSTVVLLFPKSSIKFNLNWAPQRAVKLGECMGNKTA